MTRNRAPSGLTYPEVGATAAPEPPSGYRHLRRRAVVGHGRHAFRLTVQALTSWDVHRRAGLVVDPLAPQAAPGAVVLLGMGRGPVRMCIPCQVVYVVDEPTRGGFAYGTLPGHPMTGEEAFLATLDDNGDVVVEITAFSRPARWFARWAGPVGRAGQDAMTGRYLRAAAAAARDT